MTGRKPSGADPAQPGLGDVTLSPTHPGFIIGQVSAQDGRWFAIDTESSWPAALWKAHYYATVRHVRALVSRHGDRFEVLDPDRLWLGRDLHWHALTADAVQAHAPAEPGIYVLRSLTPVYVGDTDNLRERLLYHLREPWACPAAAPLQFSIRPLEAPDRRSEQAADLIAWWAPPCNHPA
jgi:hypothetical protein